MARVAVSRTNQLTPKERVLHKTATDFRRQMLRALKKNKSFRSRLHAAKVLGKNTAFMQVTENMTASAKIFTGLQMLQSGKKARGRRFTEDEKILSLSIYKQSPKAYRFLYKIFVLPAPRTLLKVLNRVPISTGINDQLFSHLKQMVRRIPPHHRYCTLLFDEMSLSPRLLYDERKDRIEGFEDFGNNRRSNQIADHVLVFMIRGIRRKFKQPVAYTFCTGSTKTPELMFQLRAVIKAVNSTGLRVIATVCDQGKSNESAIKQLIQQTKRSYLSDENRKSLWKDEDSFFEVEGKKVIPLFDPPHLLKGMRNNSIGKSIRCKIEGKILVGKWEHLQQVYHCDVTKNDMRVLPKLTDYHVEPDKIPKMKVKYASEIFSHTVGAIMLHFASMYLFAYY